MSNWLGTVEACQKLGITSKEIYKMIKESKIPSEKRGGRWYVDVSGVKIKEESATGVSLEQIGKPTEEAKEILKRKGGFLNWLDSLFEEEEDERRDDDGWF